mmetsp:Transcript_17681/g.49525  ORF Transcript_17681/g.49525 Transcript_17681/m.49525 type:complete len:386 (-) Transcript_17681:343-1500(-)
MTCVRGHRRKLDAGRCLGGHKGKRPLQRVGDPRDVLLVLADHQRLVGLADELGPLDACDHILDARLELHVRHLDGLGRPGAAQQEHLGRKIGQRLADPRGGNQPADQLAAHRRLEIAPAGPLVVVAPRLAPAPIVTRLVVLCIDAVAQPVDRARTLGGARRLVRVKTDARSRRLERHALDPAKALERRMDGQLIVTCGEVEEAHPAIVLRGPRRDLLELQHHRADRRGVDLVDPGEGAFERFPFFWAPGLLWQRHPVPEYGHDVRVLHQRAPYHLDALAFRVRVLGGEPSVGQGAHGAIAALDEFDRLLTTQKRRLACLLELLQLLTPRQDEAVFLLQQPLGPQEPDIPDLEYREQWFVELSERQSQLGGERTGLCAPDTGGCVS